MMIMSSKGKLPFSTSPSSSSSSLSPSSSALPKETEDIPSDALALGLATSAAAAAGNGGGGGVPIEKEHMFDKVVTPSDVGKLNRLVIPKQHAEKYFPLDTASASEKGLLLNFEDRSGKHWRFRYSYWNSSQSYVLTKGWSRFVKEKRLDAGDVVLFERCCSVEGGDRLFIGWRRRGTVAAGRKSAGPADQPEPASAGNGGGWTGGYYHAHPYPSHSQGNHNPLQSYQQPDSSCLHAGII